MTRLVVIDPSEGPFWHSRVNGSVPELSDADILAFSFATAAPLLDFRTFLVAGSESGPEGTVRRLVFDDIYRIPELACALAAIDPSFMASELLALARTKDISATLLVLAWVADGFGDTVLAAGVKKGDVDACASALANLRRPGVFRPVPPSGFFPWCFWR